MRWRGLAAGGLTFMLAAAGVLARDEPSAGEVLERARALLADPVFQTELPDARGATSGAGSRDLSAASEERASNNSPQDSPAKDAPEKRAAGNADLDPTRDRDRRRGPETATEGQPQEHRRSDTELPRAPESVVLTAFFWVVVAAALIVAVGSTVRELRRARRQVAVSGDEVEARPAAAVAAGRLDEVEALARSGRFTEAVHLLLQRALERIGRRRRLERSLTSREILAGEQAGRQALSILVETVERSWFGGLAVDRAAYEHCLVASQRLSASRPLHTGAEE